MTQLLRRRPVGAQIHEGHHLQILRNPIAAVIQDANIATIIHHETDCVIARQRTIGVQGYLDTEFLRRYSCGNSQIRNCPLNEIPIGAYTVFTKKTHAPYPFLFRLFVTNFLQPITNKL